MTFHIPASERLSYRLMSDTPTDVELLWQLDQNPDVMKFINGGRMTSREEMDARFRPRMRAYYNPEAGWGLWAVTLTATNEFLGFILLRPMGFFEGDRDDRNLEIGWRFHQTHWGKGYATEAAQAGANAVIEAQICDQISAVAMPENVASINVMKKLGMEYQQTTEHDDDYAGKYSLVLYSRMYR